MLKKIIVLNICLLVFCSVSASAFDYDVTIDGGLSSYSGEVNGVAVAGTASADGGKGILGMTLNASAYAGYFVGNVHVTGALTGPYKLFVQPHTKDPSKEVAYVAAEGPEAMVFFRGTGFLKNGEAVLRLPEYFSMVAGKEGVMVQFTPKSAKSKGLAAIEVTNERIVVQELMEGKGEYAFDYFVTAKRAGFEEHQPIVSNTHFRPGPNETAEEFEDRYKGDSMSIRAFRTMLISNGILGPDGKLNRDLMAKLGWTVKEGDLALLNK